jgi:hypothetical protein
MQGHRLVELLEEEDVVSNENKKTDYNKMIYDKYPNLTSRDRSMGLSTQKWRVDND